MVSAVPVAGRGHTPCSRASRPQRGPLLGTHLGFRQKPEGQKGTAIMPDVLRKEMHLQRLARIKTIAETIPMVLCIFIKHYITHM